MLVPSIEWIQSGSPYHLKKNMPGLNYWSKKEDETGRGEWPRWAVLSKPSLEEQICMWPAEAMSSQSFLMDFPMSNKITYLERVWDVITQAKEPEVLSEVYCFPINRRMDLYLHMQEWKAQSKDLTENKISLDACIMYQKLSIFRCLNTLFWG